MNQLSIPLARCDDPLSSHEAADSILPHIEDQEDRVSRFLKLHPDCTSRELASYYAARYGTNAEVEYAMFHKRLPGLRAKSMARNGAMRQCRISGRLSQTWMA